MSKEAHWRRAEELADTTRRYLVGVNTGGIAVTFAVASALVNNRVPPGWAWPPVACFSVGLGLVLVSLLLAKKRAVGRFKAADPEQVRFPEYTHSLWWDLASAIAFGAGVIAGLWQLSGIVLPSGTT